MILRLVSHDSPTHIALTVAAFTDAVLPTLPVRAKHIRASGAHWLLVSAFLAIATCGPLIHVVHAAPIQWTVDQGGNGHFYERIDLPGLEWSEARAIASSMTFAGRSGHLATITSQEEIDFLLASIEVNPSGSTEYWLGGFQDTSAPDYFEPDGGWRWVTGETFDFTNWAANQPNELNGIGEHYLSTRAFEPWKWNDRATAATAVVGFIVEYPLVPEPGTFGMLVIGSAVTLCGGFAQWIRRTRRSSVTAGV